MLEWVTYTIARPRDAAAAAKAAFSSSSPRTSPAASRSGTWTASTSASASSAPHPASKPRQAAASGTPVPVSDADGRIAAATRRPGDSRASMQAVHSTPSVPDGSSRTSAIPSAPSQVRIACSMRVCQRRAPASPADASRWQARAAEKPAAEIGDAVQEARRTTPSVGEAAHRYLFRPVAGVRRDAAVAARDQGGDARLLVPRERPGLGQDLAGQTGHGVDGSACRTPG